MMGKKILIAVSVLAAVLAAQPATAGDEKLGARVFKKCGSCHTLGEGARNKVGPQLNGIFGRSAGSVASYGYSKVMLAKGSEGLVWNRESLTAFLMNPKKYMPGNRMSFRGLKKPADIDNLLAYLKTFSGSESN